tara:strand:+ start:290 stop:1003 length:714 start_codon:yes stop_codon:yes gene_type:complete
MILITRPVDSAKKLKSCFKEYGVESFIEPLTSIKINSKQLKFNVNHIHIVASQRSVEFLKHQNDFKDKIKKLNFVVIGAATASRLSVTGVENILYVAQDSEELINYLKRQRLKKHFRYLCGTNRNRSFINFLKGTSNQFEIIEVYKVQSYKTLSSQLITKLRSKKIRVILIFSMFNAKLFIHLISSHISIDHKKYKYVCMSKKIAQFLIKSGCKNATHAKKSTLADMVELSIKSIKK